MEYAQAIVLGIVQGLTEFLPVSSTGHLILAASLLDFHDARGKLFEIVIQSGAILAVVWEYRARFGAALAGLTREPKAQRFVLNLIVAFNFSTDIWVDFKLFGGMGLLLLFVLGQGLMLSKYVEDKQ